MKVNPKLTIALSVFAGAALGALGNDPATAFLSVTTAEHAVLGAALLGFVAVAHWLQDPKTPTPVTVNLHAVAPAIDAVAEAIKKGTETAGPPVAAFLFFAFLARPLMACGAASPAPFTPESQASYTALLENCNRTTLAADAGKAAGMACLEGVKASFCGPGGIWSSAPPDAGVCQAGPIPTLDGGSY